MHRFLRCSGKWSFTLIAGVVFGMSLAIPVFAQGTISITKVMNDPAGSNVGRQWIQVTNNGDVPFDLAEKDLRIVDKSGNHLIKAAQGGTTLAPGASVVIADNPAKYLIDYPNYSGELLKSAFTLSAAAGTVSLVQVGATKFATAQTLASFSYSAVAKPAAASAGSTKRVTQTATRSKASSFSTYAKGTNAPTAAADAAAVGADSFALPSLPTIPFPNLPLFSSVYFAAFLALLAFSGFSLIVIQRHDMNAGNDKDTAYANIF